MNNTITAMHIGILIYEPEHFNPNAGCRIPAAYVISVQDEEGEVVMTTRGHSINEAVWQATQEFPRIVIQR